MHQNLYEILQSEYGLSKEEIYRGKVSLTDYIEDFVLTENLLDKFIAELETFIKHFPLYAKRFFDSVSQYKIEGEWKFLPLFVWLLTKNVLYLRA